MEVKVVNLSHRTDKLKMFNEMAERYQYPKDAISVWHGHHGAAFPSVESLVGSIRLAGFPIALSDPADYEEILPQFLKEYLVVDPKAHLGLRWTYLEILQYIQKSQENTIILFDDQFLPCSWHIYGAIADGLIDRGGEIVALDPMESDTTAFATEMRPGYFSATEEAILYTPKGAENLIPLLCEHSNIIIGDVIREYYPKDKVFTTLVKTALHINNKSDFKSDIHLKWNESNKK